MCPRQSTPGAPMSRTWRSGGRTAFAGWHRPRELVESPRPPSELLAMNQRPDRVERRVQRLSDAHPAVRLLRHQRERIRLLEAVVHAARDGNDRRLYKALDALEAYHRT